MRLVCLGLIALAACEPPTHAPAGGPGVTLTILSCPRTATGETHLRELTADVTAAWVEHLARGGTGRMVLDICKPPATGQGMIVLQRALKPRTE